MGNNKRKNDERPVASGPHFGIALLGIGVISVVIVSILGSWPWIASQIKPVPSVIPLPVASSTDTPLPIPSVIPTSNKIGFIPFNASDNTALLSSYFQWQAGDSDVNAYKIKPDGSLVITAGPKTNQWEGTNTAPLVFYPYQGNFEAQVRVTFDPDLGCCQQAGFGVRDMDSPATWLRITKRVDDHNPQIAIEGAQQGTKISVDFDSWPVYLNKSVYFKIQKQESLLTLSYSPDGQEWITQKKDFPVQMSDKLEIYMVVVAYSVPYVKDSPQTAEFSQFTVQQQ